MMAPQAGIPRLFDANVLLGPLPQCPPGAPEELSSVLTAMDAYGLDRALVTHTLAKWHHPTAGAPDGGAGRAKCVIPTDTK